MDLTQQTYETIADRYNPPADESLMVSFATFAERMKSNGLILDVGTGPGRDANWLRGRGFTVFGLDYAMNMLKRNRIPQVQADARCLPFADESFDGINCNAMLHHIPHHNWLQTVLELRRVLKPGGYLHLTTREGKHMVWDDSYGLTNLRQFWLCTENQLRFMFYTFDIQSVNTAKYTGEGLKSDWLMMLARK